MRNLIGRSKSFITPINSFMAVGLAVALQLSTTDCLASEHAFEPVYSDGQPGVNGKRHQYPNLFDRINAIGRLPVIAVLDMELAQQIRLESNHQISEQANLEALQGRILDRLSSTRENRDNSLAAKKFSLVPALALHVDESELIALLQMPEVFDVFEDRFLKPMAFDGAALVDGDARMGFSGFTGYGQVVGILDTGVDKRHPFLVDKVVSEACFSSNIESLSTTSVCPGGVSQTTDVNSGLPCPPSVQSCDHGTRVAGIVAGASASTSGVARDAGILSIQVGSRVDDEEICGSPDPCIVATKSDVMRGLERIHSLRNSFKIASVNLGFGFGSAPSSCDDSPLTGIIEALRVSGIATVVPTGNDGLTDRIAEPACVSSAFSVGSISSDDQVSSFSNSSDSVELLAPGENISSTIPRGGSGIKNGTSFAAAFVAGALAVLREAAPDIDIDSLLDVLKETGDPVTDTRSESDARTTPRIRIDRALAALNPNGQAIDEPDGRASLPVDSSQSCPGFYVLRTHPGPRSVSGRFGVELLLRGDGSRTLEGGLNFGGRATNQINGFGAFNIANRTNEPQTIDLVIDVGSAGHLSLERRSGSEVLDRPIDRKISAGPTQIEAIVPPGFYVVSYRPDTHAPVPYSIAALSSYVDRPGGGFQGGVVFGGYHDPVHSTTAFGGFCIANAFDVDVKVLSRPTYGNSGANGLAFSVSSANEVFIETLRAPDAPSAITHMSESLTGQFPVRWPDSHGVTHYQLARSSNEGDSWISVYQGPATSVNENLPSGSYRFRVRACNQLNCSPWRESSMETTVIDNMPRGLIFRDCDDCPEMIVVSGGSFLMGSPSAELQRSSREDPQRTVNLDGFAIGRFPITFDEWEACVNDGGCSHLPSDNGMGRGSRPVINVNWLDAQQYVDWLSEKTGVIYRLPSEAEWEYSARSGSSLRFNTGDCITTAQANFDGAFPASGCLEGRTRNVTLPVESFAPNAYGLYDTHGNAGEWVEDCWNPNYIGAPTDGSAWLTGDCGRAVIRGGDLALGGAEIRSASRSFSPIESRFRLGFRVVRALDPPE